MLSPWILDEVKTAKLNDKRLNAHNTNRPSKDAPQQGVLFSLPEERPAADGPSAADGRGCRVLSIIVHSGLVLVPR